MASIEVTLAALTKSLVIIGEQCNIVALHDTFRRELALCETEPSIRKLVWDLNNALLQFLPEMAKNAFDQMVKEHPSWKFKGLNEEYLRSGAATNRYPGNRVQSYVNVLDSVKRSQDFYAKKAREARNRDQVPVRFSAQIAHLTKRQST